MKRRKGEKIYKQAAVNTVILVIILCLFLYLGIQFSRNFSVTVSTQRTQTVTDSEYVYLTGYIFRDETVVERASGGIEDYPAESGAKIGVGQVYAYFYPMDRDADFDISAKQDELYDLSEQIRRLRSGLESDGTVSDLAHINTTLSQAYDSYVDAVLDGDFSSADKSGEVLLDALVDYTVITGRDGAAESILSQLEEEKSTLLDSLGSSVQTLVSDKSCYFYHTTDGYEKIFSSRNLEEMTPEALNEMIACEPAKYGTNVIGKTVYEPKWYLALPADEATCLRFIRGKTYQITYSDSGKKTIDMTLEKICFDENGGESAYLLFSSVDLAISSEFSRAQNVGILMDSYTGYRIPAESLTKLSGEDGVFILVGNVVEFRRVTVIAKGNGYLIVNTFESDSAEGSVSEIPYLNINDLIITSGNDLYDGKLLD